VSEALRHLLEWRSDRGTARLKATKGKVRDRRRARVQRGEASRSRDDQRVGWAVEFDPSSHTYVDDRGEVPSVRTWCGGGPAAVARCARRVRADRGTSLHTAIAHASHDLLDDRKSRTTSRRPDGVAAFVLDSGWRSWRRSRGVKQRLPVRRHYRLGRGDRRGR
jgi:hypothetical protein